MNVESTYPDPLDVFDDNQIHQITGISLTTIKTVRSRIH